MNLKDLLKTAMTSTHQYLDSLVGGRSSPVSSPTTSFMGVGSNPLYGQASVNVLDRLGSAPVSKVSAMLQPMNTGAGPMQAVKSFLQDMDTQAAKYPSQGVIKQSPAPLPLAIDTALSKTQAPDWLKTLSSALTQQSAEFDPTAMGSVVGPFKGFKGLVPELLEGEIGPLYHGTSVEKAARILKEGLVPSESRINTNLMGGIYLSRFPENSYMYANNYRGGKASKGALLKVDKLPLKSMITDEDALNADFQGLYEALLRHRGEPSIPNPLPEYDHISDPVDAVRQYLLDNFDPKVSMGLDPRSMRDIVAPLTETDFKGYLKLHPYGPSTARMLGRNLSSRSMATYGMISHHPQGNPMGTMVYKGGVIEPSHISLVDGDLVNPSLPLGNSFADTFPQANAEQDLLQSVIRGLVQSNIAQGELPWWLR